MMTEHHVILTCCILLIMCRMPSVASGPHARPSSSLLTSSSDPLSRLLGPEIKRFSDDDLEFSDTSQGEVTNSDQQVVYINHGGGAVSTIRRSFTLPFSPHVSSYPVTLFEGSHNPSGNLEVGPEYRREAVEGDVGFSRRAGQDVGGDRPYDDPSFDDYHVNNRDSNSADGDPTSGGPLSHDEPPPVLRAPVHPAPLGLPVPPTSFGSRNPPTAPPPPLINDNNIINHRPPVRSLRPQQPPPDHRIAEPDQRNHQRINFPTTPQPFHVGNINPITGIGNKHNNHNNNNSPFSRQVNNNNGNPLLNAFSPIASGFPQALNPDFFNLFDAPFSPIGANGFPGVNNGINGNNAGGSGNDNLFQRRRLSIQNNGVPPSNEISHNSLSPVGAGYPNYNYYAGGEETDSSSAKWPKIFKFTDGRINLYDFEKDKKIGRIKFSKGEDPLFDGVRRDSFLILHGGTYS